MSLLEPIIKLRKLPQWLSSNKSAYNAGDTGSTPESGSFLEEGHSDPMQHFCLGSSIDRGAWWATVHGVTKSQTRLND